MKPLVKQSHSKNNKYITYAAILVFFAFVVGAVAFLLYWSMPTPYTPIWGPISAMFGTFYVAFPWFNYVSLGGLVVLGGLAAVGYLLKESNKNPAKLLLIALVIALLLTVFFGLSVTWATNNNQLPQNNLYSTPTPYPTWTPQPSVTTYPTTDPNVFSITQRTTTEYVYSYNYMNPTSYSVEPVITATYTHGISIFGSYKNWNYDIYVQVGGDGAFWSYATSGVTDNSGNGAAYAPIYAENAGQIHKIVAVINPDGGVPVSYSGFTAGEMSDLIADGTLRASNVLSFEVIDGGYIV